MLVYLWSASDPGRFSGVSDSETRARQRAEYCLQTGQASVAFIEQAFLVTSATTLTHCYERTGNGWRALQNAGGITWTSLRAAS